MSLEPISPERALELYLIDKENDVAESTIKAHRYRLGHFIRWCDQNNITNLNPLTGRKLHEYRLWRRNEGNLNKVSEKTQMDTLRVFIRWLESIDGVQQDLSEKVLSPTITANENSRDVLLDTDRATKILAYLEKYEYATVKHLTIAIAWHTMMRVGAIHALDVDDYNSSEQYITVRHRPDTGTPIKNQGDGERYVALSSQMCELIDDWLLAHRHDVTDDYGRDPLLTSARGRISTGTLRDYVYRWSRPCVIDQECPHDRSPENCKAMDHGSASQCPSSISPHAIRRGSITHCLNSDMPGEVVSDRANVSQAVIDQHYDRRTEREKMEQRRGYLNNI